MATKTPKNPDEAALRAFALAFPETTEDFPWGHRALKIRGKAFVFMGTGKDGGVDHDDFFISCKLPESASFALTIPGVAPTGYGLGRSGWVSARFAPGKAPVAMLKDWLRESYRAIAPKKLAALLDAPTSSVAAKKPSKAGAATRTRRKSKTRTTRKSA